MKNKTSKISKYEVWMILLLLGVFSVNPPQVGNTKGEFVEYSQVLDTTVISPVDNILNEADKKIEAAKQLNNKLDKLPNKPKVIYKTRTIKPSTITLYIRHPDGTVSEQQIKSDGGFYIVDEKDLHSGSEVEIEEDTTPRKRWIKRLFQ